MMTKARGRNALESCSIWNALIIDRDQISNCDPDYWQFEANGSPRIEIGSVGGLPSGGDLVFASLPELVGGPPKQSSEQTQDGREERNEPIGKVIQKYFAPIFGAAFLVAVLGLGMAHTLRNRRPLGFGCVQRRTGCIRNLLAVGTALAALVWGTVTRRCFLQAQNPGLQRKAANKPVEKAR
jgi:hypothetical protein